MAKLVNTQIVKDYRSLCQQVGIIINSYGMNQTHFYNKVVPMSKLTWYKRINKGHFPPDELEKICKYINRED